MDALIDDDDPEIRAWARRLAAQLPPLTADEARELGILAARIDARRAEQARQAQVDAKAAVA